MKIAYVVLAHRYPEQLIRLILRLNTENTSFFVHFDKKSDDKIYNQLVSELSHLPNVYFLKGILVIGEIFLLSMRVLRESEKYLEKYSV
jgi:hypothetical protein